jgi:hypothetical protein
VWRCLVLVLAVGCSFRPHAIDGDAPAPPMIDGRVDAPHDARLDARPDAPADARPDVPPDACVDVDHDGICDSVDDWLCGVKPAAPGDTVTMTGNNGATSITLTTISAGGSQLLDTTAGATFALSFHYDITDTACASACRDQIEVGYVPGTRIGCMFDAVVSKTNGASGDVSKNETAPTTAGVYDLRANIGQGNSCGTQTAWWANVTPPDTRTIAKVCVH